jgi:hypothetical protein
MNSESSTSNFLYSQNLPNPHLLRSSRTSQALLPVTSLTYTHTSNCSKICPQVFVQSTVRYLCIKPASAEPSFSLPTRLCPSDRQHNFHSIRYQTHISPLTSDPPPSPTQMSDLLPIEKGRPSGLPYPVTVPELHIGFLRSKLEAKRGNRALVRPLFPSRLSSKPRLRHHKDGGLSLTKPAANAQLPTYGTPVFSSPQLLPQLLV